MALMRWRPQRDLLSIRDEMDRLFNDFFGTIPDRFGSNPEGIWSPNADVSETDNEVIVSLELPGVNKENVNVSLQDNVLTIRGEKRQEKEDKNGNYHRVERSYGSFQRSFAMPMAVDSKKIKANFKDGVLKIVMPKTEETKRKAIPINVE